MSGWNLLADLRLELARDEVRPYARLQCGTLRRAGISTEFTLASALACWRRLESTPPEPQLALLWTNLTFAGTESLACLTELLEVRDLPMPFQFIASQPHMAAVYAHGLLPGLVHAGTLVQADGDLADTLLPALSRRQTWTHALLGEVSTPNPQEPGGALFQAHWRVLGRVP